MATLQARGEFMEEHDEVVVVEHFRLLLSQSEGDGRRPVAGYRSPRRQDPEPTGGLVGLGWSPAVASAVQVMVE